MKKRILPMLAVLALLLVLPALSATARADSIGTYVRDYAGLLSDADQATLETEAAHLAQEYGCGVYVLTVDNYRNYYTGRQGVFGFADEYYFQEKLGVGTDRSGLLLVLSVAERDYAIYAYGSIGDSAFSYDAQDDVVIPAFLAYFHANDWFGGFREYYTVSGNLLRMAAEGHPYKSGVSPVLAFVLIVLVPGLVAFLVCSVLRARHKTAVSGRNANAYVVQDSLQLNYSTDQFTHVTEQRIAKESESSGGHSTGSHGGHGSSGKF